MIPWAKPCLFGNEKDLVMDALQSTWISGGEYVDRFEKDFAGTIGTKYAVTTSNGTTALHLALLALEVGPGDEVIVPDFTFVACANTVLYTGAIPVYVDIDPRTWCIDPEEVENAISRRTKAIIPVHLYGNVCDMEALTDISKKHDLFLIEDVAEALFSKYRGRYAGSFGDVSCFSFQATKTITMGEGGAVLTDDKRLMERMRILRSHGMREGKRYWHDFVGYNYRLTNMQAALGCAQFEKKNLLITEKKRIYERYRDNLSDMEGIELQYIAKEVEPVIWAIALKIDPEYFKGEREFLIKELLRRGIETRPGFYPFSVMPIYDAPSFPVAESVGRNVLSLPSFPFITDAEIDYICEQMRDLRIE
ncbi:MAG: DegT/DnrJ/EryC1/StrS family aminotransferase [Candidatus Methanoperedenaceae archaeon]|nr:MAG: DegT/DnrJ/EryC1/StrS family aminotransferase [Candidatus Methanoperedenaceae archaeon]